MLVDLRETQWVHVELGVVRILEEGGFGILNTDGPESPFRGSGSRDTKNGAREGTTLVDPPLGPDIDHLPSGCTPPVHGVLVPRVPSPQGDVQDGAQFVHLVLHERPIERLVGGSNVKGKDDPVGLDPGQASEGMIGLGAPVGRANA